MFSKRLIGRVTSVAVAVVVASAVSRGLVTLPEVVGVVILLFAVLGIDWPRTLRSIGGRRQ